MFRLFEIRDGKFTQRLSLLRRRNQEIDINQTGTNDKAVKVQDASPTQTSASPFNL